MKKCLQIILFLFLTCVAISALAFFIWNRPKNSAGFRKITSATSVRPSPGAFVAKKLSARSASLKNYCKSKGYNMDYCFMIDMSLPSGKDRFFIYDLDKNSVRGAGLVTHGAGSVGPGGQLVFRINQAAAALPSAGIKLAKSITESLGWPTNFMDWIRATIKLLNVSWFCTRMHVYLLLKFIRCLYARVLGAPQSHLSFYKL
jgi:hypothetical protein